MLIKRAVITILGQVQGVFFRDSASQKAQALGLVGWVSNEPSGTVKVVAEGQEKDLKKFVDWCYNGPIMAKVDKVDIEWLPATGQFKEFDIKY